MPIWLKYDLWTHNRSYRTDCTSEQKKHAEHLMEWFLIDLPDTYSLKDKYLYEFKKFVIYSLFDWGSNNIPLDWRDTSRKTFSSTILADANKIYSSDVLARISHPKPSKKQSLKKITKLHEKEFPWKWKTWIHDRSFLNRAFVQYLLWYCKESQYSAFMHELENEINRFLDAWYNLKPFFFNITKATQELRLNAREVDPFSNFRFSESDKRALETYDKLSEQVMKVSEIYDRTGVPLTMIDTDDEDAWFIEFVKAILVNEEYEAKSETLDFSPCSKIVRATPKQISKVLQMRNT
jgi:hypothetical protein